MGTRLVDRRKFYTLILTPTFIGSGESYGKFETLVEGASIYIFNTDVLVDELMRRGISPNDIFKELAVRSQAHESEKVFRVKRELKDKRGAWYKIELHSTRLRRGSSYELKLFMKTAGKPFIPGSSIKGAFRTALLFNWAESNLDKVRQVISKKISKDNRRKDGKCADDELEREAFGVDSNILKEYDRLALSNRDILRSLKVTDSEILLPEDLFATEVTIEFSPYSNLPIYYEALKPLTLTEFEISIDPLIVFEGKLSFEKLLNSANRFSQAIITVEKSRVRGNIPRGFWEKLAEVSQKVTLLRLGGNIGWYSHTIGITLKQKMKDIFKDIRQKYKLGRAPRSNRLVAEFPKTYRLATYNNLKLPLGWVAISEDRTLLETLAVDWERAISVKSDVRGDTCKNSRFTSEDRGNSFNQVPSGKVKGVTIGDIINFKSFKRRK